MLCPGWGERQDSRAWLFLVGATPLSISAPPRRSGNEDGDGERKKD